MRLTEMFTDVFIKALTLIHVVLYLLHVRVDVLQLNTTAHLPGSEVPRHELLHGSVLLLLVLEVNTNNPVLIPVGQHHLVVLPVDMVIGGGEGEKTGEDQELSQTGVIHAGAGAGVGAGEGR